MHYFLISVIKDYSIEALTIYVFSCTLKYKVFIFSFCPPRIIWTIKSHPDQQKLLVQMPQAREEIWFWKIQLITSAKNCFDCFLYIGEDISHSIWMKTNRHMIYCTTWRHEQSRQIKPIPDNHLMSWIPSMSQIR